MQRGEREAPRVGVVTAILGMAAVAAMSATAGTLAAGGPTIALDDAIRIQSPNNTVQNCPIEGEPSVTVTSAGTWVAYNDDQGCPLLLNANKALHLTSVQLLPAGGGKPTYVQMSAASGGYLSGDPALTPDPQHPGGVILATLENLPSGALVVAAYAVDAGLHVTALPSPSVENTSDDKEFIASDTSPHSHWRGRTYLVWDDFGAPNNTIMVTFRAFDGSKWLHQVRLDAATGLPDVAVAPNGDIGVAYETPDGTAVQVSHDGGATFTHRVVALHGTDPGRMDPACVGRTSVGLRQRVSSEPRVVWDGNDVLHIVAAMQPGMAPPTGTASIGTGVVEHTSTRDGITFLPQQAIAAPAASDVQFDPAIARTPEGGVAVEWLETSDAQQTTYDSYLAAAAPASSTFTAPVRLSDGTARFAPAQEGMGNSECYGIGDYTGLASTRAGVVAVWPTTYQAATPVFDTDVMLRAARIGPAAAHSAVTRRAAQHSGAGAPATQLQPAAPNAADDLAPARDLQQIDATATATRGPAAPGGIAGAAAVAAALTALLLLTRIRGRAPLPSSRLLKRDGERCAAQADAGKEAPST